MTKKSVAIKRLKMLYAEKNKIARNLIDAGLFEDIKDFEEINNSIRFNDEGLFSESEIDKIEARLESNDLRQVLDWMNR